MNSGRIFTEARSSEVNILPLSLRLKRIIVLVYTHSVISTTLFVAFVFSGTASSSIFNIFASLMVAKREFTPAILFSLDHVLFTP